MCRRHPAWLFFLLGQKGKEKGVIVGNALQRKIGNQREFARSFSERAQFDKNTSTSAILFDLKIFEDVKPSRPWHTFNGTQVSN
jgi:hypothetical protein